MHEVVRSRRKFQDVSYFTSKPSAELLPSDPPTVANVTRALYPCAPFRFPLCHELVPIGLCLYRMPRRILDFFTVSAKCSQNYAFNHCASRKAMISIFPH